MAIFSSGAGGAAPVVSGVGDGTTTATIQLDVSGLPSGRPLLITWKCRNTLAANSNVTLTLNGDTGANYWNSGQRQSSTASTPGSNGTGTNFISLGFCCDTGAPTNAYAVGYFVINGWDETGAKAGVGVGAANNGSTHAEKYQDQLAGGWDSTTSAITTVEIGSNSGFLDANSWVKATVL